MRCLKKSRRKTSCCAGAKQNIGLDGTLRCGGATRNGVKFPASGSL